MQRIYLLRWHLLVFHTFYQSTLFAVWMEEIDRGKTKQYPDLSCLHMAQKYFPCIREKLKNPRQFKKNGHARAGTILRSLRRGTGTYISQSHILIFWNQKRMEWETSSKNSETVGERKKTLNNLELEFENGISGFFLRNGHLAVPSTMTNQCTAVIEKIGNNSVW